MTTKIELTAEWILKNFPELNFCEDESVVFFDFYDLGAPYCLSLLALETLNIDCSKIYSWGIEATNDTWERIFISMKELKEKCPEIYDKAIKVRKKRIEQNSIQHNPPELYE